MPKTGKKTGKRSVKKTGRKGKKKRKGDAKLLLKESIDESKIELDIQLLTDRLETVKQLHAEARDKQITLAAKLNDFENDRGEGKDSFDEFVEISRARDIEERAKVKHLLATVAAKRAENDLLDKQLTAELKERIDDVKQKAAALQVLRKKHEERQAFMERNEDVKTRATAARMRRKMVEKHIQDLNARILQFDREHGFLTEHGTDGPPSLARTILHLTPGLMKHPVILLDCFRALDDLMSPDFPASREFATETGLNFIVQVLSTHPNEVQLMAAVLRVVRKLVTLEPQTVDKLIENKGVMRMIQTMHYHPYSSDVSQAATDALMSIIPQKLLEACELGGQGWSLIEVLRGMYGKAHGSHVAVGVMKCDVKAGASVSTWKRRGSINDPTVAAKEDDSGLYLLKNRLMPYITETRGLLSLSTKHDRESGQPPRPGAAHHNQHIQVLFAVLLLFLPDRTDASADGLRRGDAVMPAAVAPTSPRPHDEDETHEKVDRSDHQAGAGSQSDHMDSIRGGSDGRSRSSSATSHHHRTAGVVRSAACDKWVAGGPLALSSACQAIINFLVLEPHFIPRIATYTYLNIVTMVMKNLHSKGGRDVAEVAARLMSFILTQRQFSMRLLRRLNILPAVVKALYIHSNDRELTVALVPVVEFFGGNYSAVMRLADDDDSSTDEDTVGRQLDRRDEGDARGGRGRGGVLAGIGASTVDLLIGMRPTGLRSGVGADGTPTTPIANVDPFGAGPPGSGSSRADGTRRRSLLTVTSTRTRHSRRYSGVSGTSAAGSSLHRRRRGSRHKLRGPTEKGGRATKDSVLDATYGVELQPGDSVIYVGGNRPDTATMAAEAAALDQRASDDSDVSGEHVRIVRPDAGDDSSSDSSSTASSSETDDDSSSDDQAAAASRKGTEPAKQPRPRKAVIIRATKSRSSQRGQPPKTAASRGTARSRTVSMESRESQRRSLSPGRSDRSVSSPGGRARSAASSTLKPPTARSMKARLRSPSREVPSTGGGLDDGAHSRKSSQSRVVSRGTPSRGHTQRAPLQPAPSPIATATRKGPGASPQLPAPSRPSTLRVASSEGRTKRKVSGRRSIPRRAPSATGRAAAPPVTGRDKATGSILLSPSGSKADLDAFLEYAAGDD